MDYKNAGVDIEAGYKSVELMKKHVQATMRPEVLTNIGGFSGAFSMDKFKGMEKPTLVSGTDGVGTKLKLAFIMDKHDTIGIDCVAMCVNDIACAGGEPLFFLDYIACGKNEPEKIATIVSGVAEGCIQSGAALIGGETAEMPGFYDVGKYDLAGFAVGVCEKDDIISVNDIKDGDVLIGLSSTGVHSNGFSLVRKLVKDFDEPFLDNGNPTGKTIGDLLLTPTRIYVRPVMEVLEKFRKSIHGMVHVTGGGFYENLPRMYPKAKEGGKQLISVIKRSSWDMPPVFGELIKRGADLDNVYHTFNMGIGFVLAVKAKDAPAILEMFNANASKYSRPDTPDMKAYEIGRVAYAAGEVKGQEDSVIFED